MHTPIVSIVIVNFNGKDYLRMCLRSLERLDFPKKDFECIVVDNNSHDLSVDMLSEDFPWVHAISLDENTGFSRGNNIGVAAAQGKYVVLLNNDTEVEPDWLSALVATAEADKSIAAVNAKILSYYPVVQLEIVSTTHTFSEFTSSFDMQSVGVQVEELILTHTFLQIAVEYYSGFLKKEKGSLPVRWTDGHGVVLLPFDFNEEYTEFLLTIRAQKSLTRLQTDFEIRVGEFVAHSGTLDSYEVQQLRIRIPYEVMHAHAERQITNAGSVVFHTGHARDRGAVVSSEGQSYELEKPYFDKLQSVVAFCGASVLLRKDVYRKLGGLDEDFFMYYEDIDMSLRMFLAGYKTVYQPRAVAYHHHAASSGEWSSFFVLQVEKNLLLLQLKHLPMSIFIWQYLWQAAVTTIALLKTIKWRIKEHWELYEELKEQFSTRKNVLLQVAQTAPSTLRKRWQLNKNAVVSKQKLYEKFI